MGIFKSYKTIAAIEVREGALTVKEPIIVRVDGKATIYELILLAGFLSFCGWKAYQDFESYGIFITFLIIMFVLLVYSRSHELSSIIKKRAYFIIDKTGITYDTKLLPWEAIERIEFLKDKTNEGFNYIRLYLISGDRKDLHYPEIAIPEFDELAKQIKRLETRFYV